MRQGENEVWSYSQSSRSFGGLGKVIYWPVNSGKIYKRKDCLTAKPGYRVTFSSCSFVFATWNVNKRSVSLFSRPDDASRFWSFQTNAFTCSSDIKATSWSEIFVKYLQNVQL